MRDESDAEFEDRMVRERLAAERRTRRAAAQAIVNATHPDATVGHGTENRFTDSIMDALPAHIQRTVRIRLYNGRYR